MTAIGVIDVFGFVGIVAALDVCLKTADVRFLRSEHMKGGIVSVVIEGDVAAVSTSIAAGVEAAKSFGGYRGHTVIARIDGQVGKMLGDYPPQIDGNQSTNSKYVEVALVINELDSVHAVENVNRIFEEALKAMSVPELRNVARSLKLKTMDKDRIKRARKSELIENILLEKNKKED